MGYPRRSVQTKVSMFFVWPGLSQLLFEAVFWIRRFLFTFIS